MGQRSGQSRGILSGVLFSAADSRKSYESFPIRAGRRGRSWPFSRTSLRGGKPVETRLERKRQEMGRAGLILHPDPIPERFARQYSSQSLYRGGCKNGSRIGRRDRRISSVENIRRVGEVARLMVDAGLVVLTAFIS